MSAERDLAVLGQATREIRDERGISSEDLATAAGIAHNQLRALEAGQLDPDYDLLLDLADGLGIRPSTLVIRWEERIAES